MHICKLYLMLCLKVSRNKENDHVLWKDQHNGVHGFDYANDDEYTRESIEKNVSIYQEVGYLSNKNGCMIVVKRGILIRMESSVYSLWLSLMIGFL